MTMNFNFKKFFKYFIIFLLCYIFLHAFTSTKALTVNNTKLVVNDTSNYFERFWNYFDTDNALIIENFNPYISDLREDVKSRAVSRTNSSSFQDFADNYYYAIVCTYKNTSTNKTLYVHFFYIPKANNDPFHFIFNFVSSTSNLDSSTTTINGRITDNLGAGSINRFVVTQDADGSNYWYGSTGTEIVNWQFRKNSSGSYYLPFSYSSDNTFTINLSNLLILSANSIVDRLYIDGNIDTSLYFGETPALPSFSDLTIKSTSNSETITTNYSLNDVIFSSTPYIDSNVQSFDNNSFGINTNYMSVGFLPNNIGSINCPYDRHLVNDVCYIYDTDVNNFNFDNVSYSNFVRYYLKNSSSIPLNPNKYYILTLRIYSQYNLSINSIRVLSGSTNNPTNISKIVVKDYYTYKDYQVVFTPDISSTFSLDFIDIYFNNYSSLTNSLSSPFSFGAFNTIKYSEFDILPTDFDLENDYNKNNLDTISKNSGSNFFSTFSINDRGLSQVVLLPLNFIRSWPSATCSPISLPLPHLSNAQLPCLSSTFSNYFGSFWTLYKIIINGFIIYRVCINLLRIIKNIYNVENNEIEVIDL